GACGFKEVTVKGTVYDDSTGTTANQYDSSDTPLDGVLIKSGSLKTTTGGGGKFSFKGDIASDPADIKLFLFKTNYISKEVNVTIQSTEEGATSVFSPDAGTDLDTILMKTN
ncbi:MAG: hypothetical protein JW827_12635, partial [Spirochaetes bacterium]|nr:hypothetical protein [Spirochaetota bacterium]